MHEKHEIDPRAMWIFKKPRDMDVTDMKFEINSPSE